MKLKTPKNPLKPVYENAREGSVWVNQSGKTYIVAAVGPGVGKRLISLETGNRVSDTSVFGIDPEQYTPIPAGAELTFIV